MLFRHLDFELYNENEKKKKFVNDNIQNSATVSLPSHHTTDPSLPLTSESTTDNIHTSHISSKIKHCCDHLLLHRQYKNLLGFRLRFN